MEWQTLFSIGISLITLVLIIWRPHNFGIGFSAIAGAILCFILGTVQPANIPTIFWVILINNTLIVLSLLGIRWILQTVGALRWLSLKIAKWHLRRGYLLLVSFACLATVISGIFTNYSSVLLLTAVVLETIVLLSWDKKSSFPLLCTVGLIADVASLPLILSNLVNSISANIAGISFGEYARVMLFVNLGAIALSILVLIFYFWRQIPAQYENFSYILANNPEKQAVWQKISLTAVTENNHNDHNDSSILDKIHQTWQTQKRQIFSQQNLWKLISSPIAQIILFSWGISIVFLSLHQNGLDNLSKNLFTLIASFGIYLAIILTGFVATIMACLFHNIPVALINTLSIQYAPIIDGGLRDAMIYANIIGCVVGAKISPWGSLSTLLWLADMNSFDLHLSWRNYWLINLVLIPPILLMALFILSLTNFGS
ncbi:MAG: ArsB/NhaD family transporter [Microcoleaceae cyanobacterium]